MSSAAPVTIVGGTAYDRAIEAVEEQITMFQATLSVLQGLRAKWVEFGHRLSKGRLMNFGKRARGKVIGRVPAYPFLRPSWETSQQTASEAFIESVSNDLQALQTSGGK